MIRCAAVPSHKDSGSAHSRLPYSALIVSIGDFPQPPVFAVPCEEILFTSYCQARAVFYHYDTSSFAADMELAMPPVAKTLFVIFLLLFGGCAGEGTRDSTKDETRARGTASPGFVARSCPTQSSKLVEIGKKLVRHGEKEFGSDHPGTAFYINRLAGLYLARGCYAEAEPLFKRALAIWEKAHGPDHLSVAENLSGLAGLYFDQGRYAEAKPRYERALAIAEKALEPDDLQVALSLNNLGELYRVQGRYAEAESLHKRALAIREKGSWPDNPRAAHSLHNLALVYRAQGRYAEAEPLLIRALGIWKKSLGDDLLYEAMSLENYAGLLRETGRSAEAAKMEARAKAIRAKHAKENPAM